MSAAIHNSRFDARGRAIGSAMKHLRSRRGWSGRELAARLSEAGHQTSQAVIGKMEKGTRQITSGDLLAMAHVFEVSVADILDHEAANRELLIADLEAQIAALRAGEREPQ